MPIAAESACQDPSFFSFLARLNPESPPPPAYPCANKPPNPRAAAGRVHPLFCPMIFVSKQVTTLLADNEAFQGPSKLKSREFLQQLGTALAQETDVSTCENLMIL